MSSLEQRWQELWEPVAPSPRAIKVGYARLRERYAEPHRAFHTLPHVDYCLRTLDFTSVHMWVRGPTDIEIALWYHDAVYEIGATDNEKASADFAQEQIAQLGASDLSLASVPRLIMATTHRSILTDRREQLVADIDLSTLGVPWEQFEANSVAIQKEYASLSGQQWLEGRRQVLQSFLDRQQIYYLTYFQRRYETQARANLARAIAELG